MTDGAARHAYLDRVRGLAVLIMVEAHVLDSWTRTSDRSHPGFGYAMMLAGMAAPFFLFLAGIAVALSAESKFRKSGDLTASWRAIRNRGWQVFGLAFLFRLQSYVLGGGQNASSLLKVDILNIMGPSIAMAAAAGGLVSNPRARWLLLATVALAISLLTPLVRTTPLLDWLPDPVEWYFRPSQGRANFTLFPWAGFVFAGAVAGATVNWGRTADKALRAQLMLAMTAVFLVLLAYRASFLPTIYAKSEFWTSSPTYFWLRVGLCALLLPLAYAWDRLRRRWGAWRWSPLEALGKASLFVYWVHVELVYGVWSWPLRKSLSFDGVLVAYALFTGLLLGLVALKNRIAEGRSGSSVTHQGPTQALSN